MHYNLTLFGNPFACTETTNNTSDKEGWLSEIVAFSEPDVLCVNEMADSDLFADRLLDNALNTDGVTHWARAELTDFATTSSIVNAFYYRSDRFALHSQRFINRALDDSFLLRPTDFYTIYPIPVIGDTIFITCAVLHLAASDAGERSDQTEATMAELSEMGAANYIVSGDMNIDSSEETAFQYFLDPPDETVRLFDPVDLLGEWNNNSFYADVHTQSTRLSDTNVGCFAPGGLDDRFDMTLLSTEVMLGHLGLSYIDDSYRVLGQDGTDYNQALSRINNADVPDEIANALYEMSDHLPVITDFAISPITSLTQEQRSPIRVVNPVGDRLRLLGELTPDIDLTMMDIGGRVVAPPQGRWGHGSDLDRLSPGVYLLKVDHASGRAVFRLLKE